VACPPISAGRSHKFGQLFIYNSGGTTAVPARAATYPESISLTDDGTSLLYTL
jgi:hypothetical protein